MAPLSSHILWLEEVRTSFSTKRSWSVVVALCLSTRAGARPIRVLAGNLNRFSRWESENAQSSAMPCRHPSDVEAVAQCVQ